MEIHGEYGQGVSVGSCKAAEKEIEENEIKENDGKLNDKNEAVGTNDTVEKIQQCNKELEICRYETFIEIDKKNLNYCWDRGMEGKINTQP